MGGITSIYSDAQAVAAQASASAGAVGTYALLGETSTTRTTAGGTQSGSSLQFAGAFSNSSFSSDWVGSTQVGLVGAGGSPSGTWRCMGQSRSSGLTNYGSTMWLRIA